MSRNSLTLYAITHTETYYNKNRIFTGRKDSLLTPLGRRQAQEVATKLKNRKLGLVFVSPLRRCRQTLKPILKLHPEAQATVDRRLVERSYGKLEGKNKIKYKTQNPKLYHIHHRSYEVAPPGGESMIAVEKRVLPFLKNALKLMRARKTNALIIAHNNSLRPIRRYFEKLTPSQMMRLDNYHQIFEYKI